MRIAAKRKINKATDKLVDEIIDAVLDHTDFDVEMNGYQDYDVHLFVNKNDRPALTKVLHEIFADKKPRRWWQLVNVSVRRAK